MWPGARRPSSFAVDGRRAGQRWLGLVEDQTLGDDGVVAPSDHIDQGGLQRRTPLAGQVGGMAGAPQQPLHPARPVLLLDLDHGVRAGSGQGMPHASQGVIGLPVDDDAGDAVEQAAAPGRDAVEDQPHGAGDMQPLRPARKPVYRLRRCLI